MFKKLLSNLPFNPSLIGQVSFYAKRLHRESVARRAGFVAMALALVLQMFAVISPPQPSLASSSSDLITGGFSKQSEAVTSCKQDERDYKKILAHYGITCQDVADAHNTTIAPRDYDSKLHSMGRLSYGTSGETPVKISGAGTLYLRHFYSLNYGNSYKALTGTTKYGMKFFILYGCGNLVLIGIPNPPKKCQYNSNLPANSPDCFKPCPIKGKESIPATSPQCFEPCPYNKSIKASSPDCYQHCTVKGKESLPKDSPDCFVPCVYDASVAASDTNCKPCEASQTSVDKTSCLIYSKTAANLTANIPNADGTTAHANDQIEYSIKTTNNGKADIKAFAVSENISDVLDYATVVDLHGGTIDSSNVVSWPKTDIKAGATNTQKITVKIKDPIPNTPASSSDPAHFDMTMTNVYGNAINIKLPPTVIKTTELVTTTLPNTGPGTSLLIASITTMVIGYFFARSRLLAKELDIVRTDFSGTGGI